MKIRLFLVIALSAAVVSACVVRTHEAYEKILERWVGGHVDELVRSWGPPSRSHKLTDGSTVYQWEKSRTFTTGGYSVPKETTATIYGPHGPKTATIYGSETIPSQTHYVRCETNFTVDGNGIIRSWSYNGSDCVARPED